MKFQTLGRISSHIPPRSLSTPSSWKVLLTCDTHKCTSHLWNFIYDSDEVIEIRRGLMLYLMDDSLCGWSIWGVQNLPHEQRLQSSPDHPGNGAGLEAPHHVVTIGSWRLNTETFLTLNLVWQERKKVVYSYFRHVLEELS